MSLRGRKLERNDYNLDLDKPPGASAGPIDYDPEPPLDIDLTPIDGDDLRTWRERQRRQTEGRGDVAPQWEMAGRLGTTRKTWGDWERDAMSRHWSALFREWVRAGQSFEIADRRARPGEVAALMELLGGYRRFSECLAVSESAARRWVVGDGPREAGAPQSTGAGPLIIWLVGDMGLAPVEEIVWDDYVELTYLDRDDVLEIRRRRATGESCQSIAEDIGTSDSTVDRVARGETWADIGRGADE